MKRSLFICLLLVLSCKTDNKPDKAFDAVSEVQHVEAITLLGDTLRTPKALPGKLLDNYNKAKQQFESYPDSVDALIWYGRRTAYMRHFQKAISIYSEGIKKFPNDARLYRHRGHRYITIREYDKAIEDLKKAAELMIGKEDQIEPDGIPNARNTPISTLKGNIWYHLGLAYYLNGDLENALWAYQQRETTNTNDDNLVSEGHWLYMIQKRMGLDEKAVETIEAVDSEMDIIENINYQRMCLFYKGILDINDLKIKGDGSSSDDVFLYGLGNWHLYEQRDTVKAKEYFKRLLDGGNKYSFAFLAAESDWNRLFKNN